MSGQDEEADVQPGGDKEDSFPRVLVALAGEERPFECSYPNLEVHFQKDETVQEFYNNVAAKPADMFLFIDKGGGMISEDGLKELVLYLAHPDRDMVAAVYADVEVFHNGHHTCCKNNPSYSSTLVKERVILNTPFLVKGEVVPAFHEKIENLYLWDGLMELTKRALLGHYPKPLFTSSDGLKNKDLSTDYRIINGIHFKQ